MCAYFIEIGRNVSWIFALDFANQIFETFSMLFDDRKQKGEIVTWAFRKMAYALAQFSITDLYKEYEGWLEELKDEPMLYLIFGESRGKYYSSKGDVMEDEMMRHENYFSPQKDDDNKKNKNRSVPNNLYKLLFQMVFLLLNNR